jgi:hypothetical protein
MLGKASSRQVLGPMAMCALSVLFLAACGGEGSDQDHPFAAMNALHEAANEGRNASAGEEGDSGEAPREGPRSPAAEQVANRAFPRNYVDDRLARREARAFAAIPGSPRRSSFASAARACW